MSGLELRAATAEDAPAAGRLLVRTWRHAYAELLPPDLLEALDEDERAAAVRALVVGATGEPSDRTSWSGLSRDGAGSSAAGEARSSTAAAAEERPRASRSPPGPAAAVGRVVLVAELVGDVVGLAAGETVSPEVDARPGEGALRALYVAPHAQGAGVGRLLLREATARLRAAGARRLTLRTLEGAFWAAALYAGEGWRPEPDAPAEDLAGTAVQRWALPP